MLSNLSLSVCSETKFTNVDGGRDTDEVVATHIREQSNNINYKTYKVGDILIDRMY